MADDEWQEKIRGFIEDHDGCHSDELMAGIDARTLAQRRAAHAELNAMVWSGPLAATQDHTYVPASPTDVEWDLRWEHLTILR